MESFERVFQPSFEEVYNKDYYLKGKWSAMVFHNDQPLVLELGCGKGEYTVNLARKFPGKNFIGIDIKGARLWRGAKIANEHNLFNAAFLRTRIEMIESFFGMDEVSEIWITFPDPQVKKRRNKKRLTSSRFLNHYRQFLADQGVVHLKTDNDILFSYTRDLVIYNELELLAATHDLYHSEIRDDVLSIQTFYEKQFLAEGKNINYLAFRLNKNRIIKESPGNETG